MCSLLFEDSLVTVASVRARTRFLRDPWCGFVRPSARLGSRFESRLRLCPRPRVKPRRDCFRLRLRLRLRLRESTQTTPSPFRQRSPRQRWLSKSVSKPRSHRLHRVLELFLAPSFQTSLPKVCPISRRICAIQSRRFAFLCLRQRFERDSFVYRKLSMIAVYMHQWENGSKCFPLNGKVSAFHWFLEMITKIVHIVDLSLVTSSR